jgi:hypothetical protein
VIRRAAALAALVAMIPAISTAANMSHIDAYVTPYYNSTGPVIRVGPYSAGLASSDPKRFVGTIQQMKKRWASLSFVELYVAAMRLYDLGYRNEATYWFYSAQYAGRQYQALVDQKKLGSIGDAGFELLHAQDAFFQLAGPYVNSFAFSDDRTTKAILQKVRDDRRSVPDMRRIYPGVAFIAQSQWAAINAQIDSGLGQLEAQLPHRPSGLTSRGFPGGF